MELQQQKVMICVQPKLPQPLKFHKASATDIKFYFSRTKLYMAFLHLNLLPVENSIFSTKFTYMARSNRFVF